MILNQYLTIITIFLLKLYALAIITNIRVQTRYDEHIKPH